MASIGDLVCNLKLDATRFLMDARRRPSYERQVLEPLRATIEALRATDPHKASRATECLLRHELAIHSADVSDTAHIWLTAAQEAIGTLPAGATEDLACRYAEAHGPQTTRSQHVESELVARRRTQIGGAAGLSDGGQRAKVCFHEASHATGFCLRNHGDRIRLVEIADEGKTLSGGALGHVIFRTVPRDVEIFATVAALAGTAMREWSAWGASADFEELIRLGAIERGAVLDTSDTVWMLREPDSLRALREAVEERLRPVQRFTELLASELYAVGRLTGEQVSAAWSRWHAAGGTIRQQDLFA